MEEPAPATTEAAAPAVEMPAETSASDEKDSASPLVLEQGTPRSATVDVTDDQLIIRLQKNSDAVDAMRKDSPAVRTDAEEVATRAPAKEPEDTTAEDKEAAARRFEIWNGMRKIDFDFWSKYRMERDSLYGEPEEAPGASEEATPRE